MALDFYDINDLKRNTRLFCLSETDLVLLDDALSEMNRASGISMDFYGTSRLYPSQVQFLIASIKVSIENLPKFGKGEIVKTALLTINQKLATVGEGFLIIGD